MVTNEIDVNDIYKKTFNRIAKWHNQVPDMPEGERLSSLHVLTSMLLHEIGEKFGEKFGIPINFQIAMSPELREKIDEIKKEEGFITGDPKMKKMFGSKDENDFLED